MASGVLAESFGPGAIAVTVVGVADETELTAWGEFLFETAKVGAQFVIIGDTEMGIFELATEGERELFFERLRKIDWLDLPTEALTGLFGELDAHARFVDARALELRKAEQRIESIFDFGEGLLVELDAKPVVNDGAEFFSDIDDAEVVFSGDVEA